MSRSYIAIRREEGRPDVTTNFPVGAAHEYALEWCRADGYKVTRHEYSETPDNEKFFGTIIVTVEPKPKPQTCPHCQEPGMVEVVDGKTYYSHKQSVEFGKDTVTFGFKYCPEPPKRKAKMGK